MDQHRQELHNTPEGRRPTPEQAAEGDFDEEDATRLAGLDPERAPGEGTVDVGGELRDADDGLPGDQTGGPLHDSDD